MRLVFWQNALAYCRSSYLSELVKTGHEVVVVIHDESARDTDEMGRPIPALAGVEIVKASSDYMVKAVVQHALDESFHIMGNARLCSMGKLAIAECTRAGARIGLIAEAADSTGPKGYGRRTKYGREQKAVGDAYDFIMAMGQLGVKWFVECGYPSDRVFPFGYFIEAPPESRQEDGPHDEVRMIYIGELVHRAGLDVVVEALGSLADLKWSVHIVGDGPDENALKGKASQIGIADRITWYEDLHYEGAMWELSQSDLLVLPSRFDAWGIVINEALMMGVPAICTNRCGAADLLQEDWLGAVIRSRSADDLTAALRSRIERGRLKKNERKRIREWSKRIEGAPAAKYLVDILHHVYHNSPRPTPPWYPESHTT